MLRMQNLTLKDSIRRQLKNVNISRFDFDLRVRRVISDVDKLGKPGHC